MTLAEHTADVATGGDLSSDDYHWLIAAASETGLAVDLETTGLDPRSSRIEVVSLSVPARAWVIPIESNRTPHRVTRLLEHPQITTIYHHALFDLTFMRRHWDVHASNVLCTKVAARLAGLGDRDRLADLARLFAGVDLDKSLQLSDWTTRPLSRKQIAYALADVAHLHQIARELLWRVSDLGLTSLLSSAMEFLPARVEFELRGLGDVFVYESNGSS